ncbi:hypothetical protein ACSBR1_019922 [Camellia fascicularis]
MGVCTSQFTRRCGTTKYPPTAMIIDMDANLQEFKQPIKAYHILSQNPNSFLCSSETMYVGSRALHVPYDEELQPGQTYFLMPLPTKSQQTPLSLQDLCALAIKASTALNNSVKVLATTKTLPFSDKNWCRNFRLDRRF